MKQIESGIYTDDGLMVWVFSYSPFDRLEESDCPWPACEVCKSGMNRDLHFGVYTEEPNNYRPYCSVPCAQLAKYKALSDASQIPPLAPRLDAFEQRYTPRGAH